MEQGNENFVEIPDISLDIEREGKDLYYNTFPGDEEYAFVGYFERQNK